MISSIMAVRRSPPWRFSSRAVRLGLSQSGGRDRSWMARSAGGSSLNPIRKCCAPPLEFSRRCPTCLDLIFLWILFLLIAPTSQAAAIHEAAKKGDVAAISAALDEGADANASDGIATPLYYAIDRAHLEAAKLLIARGANANLAAKWGPPLLVAAESGKPELVKLLLDAGADAAAVFKGQTALHTVARNGCLDCVVALVEKGADVNALTSFRQPPIHFAKEEGHEAIADYLLSHGYTFPAPPPVTPPAGYGRSG